MSMVMPQNEVLRILAVDTSSSRGSVALLEGRSLVAELRLCTPETHSAGLLRSVDFLLDCTKVELESVALVAACVGPGSFTGIRIGIATAIGLAQTLSIPFAGISGLDAAAHALSHIQGTLGIVLDAQRNQVFHAQYASDGGKIRRESKPSLLAPSELGRQLAGKRIFLAGDGAQRYRAELGATTGRWPRIVSSELFLAAEIGRLALSRKQIWRKGEFICAEPLYIRPPDAIRPAAHRRSPIRA